MRSGSFESSSQSAAAEHTTEQADAHTMDSSSQSAAAEHAHRQRNAFVSATIESAWTHVCHRGATMAVVSRARLQRGIEQEMHAPTTLGMVVSEGSGDGTAERLTVLEKEMDALFTHHGLVTEALQRQIGELRNCLARRRERRPRTRVAHGDAVEDAEAGEATCDDVYFDVEDTAGLACEAGRDSDENLPDSEILARLGELADSRAEHSASTAADSRGEHSASTAAQQRLMAIPRTPPLPKAFASATTSMYVLNTAPETLEPQAPPCMKTSPELQALPAATMYVPKTPPEALASATRIQYCAIRKRGRSESLLRIGLTAKAGPAARLRHGPRPTPGRNFASRGAASKEAT